MHRHVIVTGASRGIGKAVALAFASAGDAVTICSHASEGALFAAAEDMRAAGAASVTALTGDVADPAFCRQLADAAAPADILIHSAGMAHYGLLQDMTDEEWDRLMAVNLSSAFYLSRAVIPGMVRAGHGKILFISSVWGIAGASCEAAYSASKGGLNALAKSLGKELAPANIQVNALALGVIDTAMNGHLDAAERAALAEQIPAGRFGTPEEAAALALQLCTGNDYLTGQVITLDGGFL